MISLVIPTFNEASVIEETLRQACAALRLTGDEFEIIVADDSSPDGTADIAEAMSRELPVRALRRTGPRGLAASVVDGWATARGDVVGVMDADLQHPPEVLTALARALDSPNVDIAAASRYVPGGGTSGWSWLRRLISWAGMRLGASVLPWTLGEIADSGSGMFLVRASALKDAPLEPIGIKMLLEVLTKARYRDVAQVPYVFRGRTRGESKLGARQYFEYLVHLARAGHYTGEVRTWICFGAVGFTGAAINIGALYLLVERARWPLVLAVPAAIELALLSNFIWNHEITFRNQQALPPKPSKFLSRILRCQTLYAPGALVNALVTIVSAKLGAPLPTAAAGGIIMGGLWNMLFTIPKIWRVWQRPRRPGQVSAPDGSDRQGFCARI